MSHLEVVKNSTTDFILNVLIYCDSQLYKLSFQYNIGVQVSTVQTRHATSLGTKTPLNPSLPRNRYLNSTYLCSMLQGLQDCKAPLAMFFLAEQNLPENKPFNTLVIIRSKTTSVARLDSCVFLLNLSMPTLSSDFYLLSEVVSILLFLISLPPRKPGRYFIICVKVSTVKVLTKQKSEQPI